MASIQIYFEGAKFFSLTEGDEARGPRAGVVLGRGSEPHPHQLRSMGSAVGFPSGVWGGDPENLKFGAT